MIDEFCYVYEDLVNIRARFGRGLGKVEEILVVLKTEALVESDFSHWGCHVRLVPNQHG